MAFKFAVVSRDGDVFETFESAVPNWDIGDTVILGPTAVTSQRERADQEDRRGPRRAAVRRARGEPL